MISLPFNCIHLIIRWTRVTKQQVVTELVKTNINDSVQIDSSPDKLGKYIHETKTHINPPFSEKKLYKIEVSQKMNKALRKYYYVTPLRS